MRQKLGEAVVGDLVDAVENVRDVLDGVHASTGAGDDERVEERELLAGLFAVHEEEVTAERPPRTASIPVRLRIGARRTPPPTAPPAPTRVPCGSAASFSPTRTSHARSSRSRRSETAFD